MKKITDKELKELILNKFDENFVNYGLSNDGKKLTWIDDGIENVIDAVFKVIKELKN